MKLTLLFIFLSISAISAQTPCEFSENTSDSTGIYKETKEYLIAEKNFAGKSTYIFFALMINKDMPLLKIQIIQKSKGFVTAMCFDKTSKIYIDLMNGKTITLLNVENNNCGALIRNENINNRVLSGTFAFSPTNFDDLTKYSISIIKIQSTLDTNEYIIKSKLTSEMDGKTYQPDTYFMKYFDCLR